MFGSGRHQRLGTGLGTGRESDAAVVPSDLAASDFTVFTRPDGQRQSAYKGHPLYFFAGDAAPGDTTGRGVANRDTVDPRNTP